MDKDVGTIKETYDTAFAFIVVSDIGTACIKGLPFGTGLSLLIFAFSIWASVTNRLRRPLVSRRWWSHFLNGCGEDRTWSKIEVLRFASFVLIGVVNLVAFPEYLLFVGVCLTLVLTYPIVGFYAHDRDVAVQKLLAEHRKNDDEE